MKKLLFILILIFAGNSVSQTDLNPSVKTKQNTFPINSDLAATPCGKALSQGAVCEAANQFALEFIKSNQLEAMTVVQDVRTGALVAFAASEPTKLDAASPILPLSLTKVFLAAAWWDNGLPDSEFENIPLRNPANRRMVKIPEIIYNGSDSAGRQMATELRKALGTKKVLQDFERYGLGKKTKVATDKKFWAKISRDLKARLTPNRAYFSADETTGDKDWADFLSIGEANFQVTGLHISRFMQAVGNDGVLILPFAIEEKPDVSANQTRLLRHIKKSSRMMQADTAKKLQAAMLETVRQGTAQSIAPILAGTGWKIGGKTGSMGKLQTAEEIQAADGWFAGLIFDPQGKARFTVATFVRHGGFGGGNAAKISANLARFIIEGKSKFQ